MKNRFTFLAFFLLLIFLHACLDPEEYDLDRLNGIEISPAYALPLVKGSLGIHDLLNSADSQTLAVRDDQVLYFQYRERFSSNSINEMLVLPDAGVSKQLTLPSNVTVPANSEMQIMVLDTALSLATGGYELRTILYKSGQLLYEMSSNMAVPLEVAISFPSVKNVDVSLAKIVQLNTSGTMVTGATDLLNYAADLTTQAPGYNTLPVVITVTAVNNTSTDVTLNQGTSLTAGITFSEQDYELTTGFFGDTEHNFPNLRFPIGPFSDMLKYDAYLSEIDLRMVISNGYGVPINASFPVFEAVNEAGETLAVQTDPATGILINSAETPGEEGKTNFSILNEVEVANFNPVEIRYNVKAHLNQGLSTANNFALDDSRLSFDLAADIPLIGWFREIVIEDTLDIDLGSQLGDADISKLSMKTQLTNQFPFGGTFQLYTLDSEQNITDSLLLENQTEIIVASSVTATGDLLDPGKYNENIVISSEKFDKLLNASQIIIRAKLGTVHDQNNAYSDVKFKANYTIAVDLGVIAEFETTIEP